MADPIDVGPPLLQLGGGRSRKGVVLAVVLVVLGAAAVFGWLSLSDQPTDGSSAKSPASTASVGDSVAATEFVAFQAQTAASLQSATQLLASQQAELKRLSEQLAGLTARIDTLQSQLATPAPGAAPTAASSPPAAAPRAPTAPRKRPAPAPAGAISVGGAPLPGAAPAR
ncbi:MAG: hypothetical protein H7267_00780 [Sandarakinorhabdus sp.]|nr:hypothetical protein [Sandarakinorhabdus sp.]